ncbi:beta-ketoacyl-[acyl-carrier-protein] synthase family protein [Streptacidiphilus fuscans]|uniref:Beta-ketoacyl-[acyl-carrier-protein] synthase family protein n=1 Tax=Streptacidiphilus fuscans TaxID=2789292 RepID=A0A931B5K4_9ACTN|nr:beta-ketoacyl-[acyl-carrier-protein] synthase family protein [Streptacidiphilus fuscans]MBF9070601.1 beta-ketoacyl-[acyl-carrier-protein] synthase family protein [Streptacidiphilus fuscans]
MTDVPVTGDSVDQVSVTGAHVAAAADRAVGVVVVSVGAITPQGGSAEALWDGVRAGKVAISPVRRLPMDGYQTTLGGEVTEPRAPGYDYAPGSDSRDLSVEYALAAAEEAMASSGLRVGADIPAERWGVAYGTCHAGWRSAELALREVQSGRTPDWHRYTFVPPQAGAEALSAAFGLKGPVLSVNTACASSAHAIAHALEVIRAGAADAMLVGGSDAFTESAFAGFSSLWSLSPLPAAPYSKDRSGLTLGEGGGMLLLLSREAAERTGAAIVAEVLGYGLTADGYHPTAPHPEGEGAARAIRAALASSGLTPDDIRYVNGHGTGTEKNDSAESNAVRAAFGEAAEKTSLSSTKSMIGHLLGAAGAVEGIVTVLALRDQVAPPTANFGAVDAQCGLDPVPGTGRPMVLDTALSNNFGFAGANATVAFARPGGPGAPAPAVGPDDVVVTGFGVITPAGEGAEALWEAYAAGRRQGVLEDGLRVARAEFDRSAAGTARERRRMDRVSQLAVAASRAALAAAALDGDAAAVAATGVVLGTGIGPMESGERFTVPVLAEGPQEANPAVFTNTVFNGAAGHVAMGLGTKGPTSTLTSGHAAGAAALGVAYDMLRAGRAERLLVPAVEAFSPATLDAYRSIPLFGSAAGRRYTLAEAGIALVLERRSSAERRGAPVLAVVLGHATASDACGIGRWDPSGGGVERAMRGALRSAGIGPDQVSAVWANAAGLAAADRAEQAAVDRVFGVDRARFEAPKRLLGEPVGAGAHLSAVLAVGAWRGGGDHRPALINSSSLGGTHTSLVLSPVSPAWLPGTAHLPGTESVR